MKNLKTIFTSILIALFCIQASFAQTSKQENRVKEIRKIYSQAQTDIADNSSEEETNNSMTINMRRMFGGIGMQNKKLDFFYDIDDSRTNGTGWSLYFVKVNYNIAARKIYEEYLFNKKTGKVIFIYRKEDTYDANVEYYEDRCYYYPDGTLCKYYRQAKNAKGQIVTVKNDNIKTNTEVAELKKSADSIKKIFNSTVQSE